jgi:hypothetical protein
MSQETDHMEASCVLNVKVGWLGQFEQSKFSISSATALGIVTLIVQYDLIVSV